MYVNSATSYCNVALSMKKTRAAPFKTFYVDK